jgi:hypothetical protein
MCYKYFFKTLVPWMNPKLSVIVFGASNNYVMTCLGTQPFWMKFTIKENISNPKLDIIIIVVVAQLFNVSGK